MFYAHHWRRDAPMDMAMARENVEFAAHERLHDTIVAETKRRCWFCFLLFVAMSGLPRRLTGLERSIESVSC